MSSSRLEAFSDGVLAIIITIMVLELKTPVEDHLNSLLELVPQLLAYLLSFLYVAIYWNNHHHLLKSANKITGSIMWANMNWLFWISLIPLTTGWISQFYNSTLPVLVYGVVLFAVGISYAVLQKQIVNSNGEDSALAKQLGNTWKEKFSIIAYGFSTVASIFFPLLAIVGYVVVAIIWVVPDKRLEKVIQES